MKNTDLIEKLKNIQHIDILKEQTLNYFRKKYNNIDIDYFHKKIRELESDLDLSEIEKSN